MKLSSIGYTAGILGYVHAVNRKTGRSVLITIRYNRDRGYRLGMITDACKRSETTVSISASQIMDIEKNFTGFGKDPTMLALQLARCRYQGIALPSQLHSGNVVIGGWGDLNIVAIRHDCNPWTAGAIIAVAVAVTAVSVTVTAGIVAANDYGISIKASSDGVEVEIGPSDGGGGEGGDDGGNGGNGGDGGDGGDGGGSEG